MCFSSSAAYMRCLLLIVIEEAFPLLGESFWVVKGSTDL